MSDKFWFWWHVCFAVFSAGMIIHAFQSGFLLGMVWYPCATLLFAILAAFWYKESYHE